jgi:two-component system sensor histidine kinase AtoS
MQKMHRTEQMVVVGELAAGLAHEIKNPMAGIKVAMGVLSEEPYISTEDKAVLRKVVDQVTQLEGLMKNFLNFAKPREPRLEAVNVNQVLNTTLAFHLKHQGVGSGGFGKIEIVKEFGELPPTQADPTQLQQVFLNLFLNALHAMPRGGELGVRTCLEEDGQAIRIEVSDTGSGIREDLIKKIFQPFFTTKPKGTGLGLAISRQMIERHDGAIAVANRPGGGVRFTIRLPVKAEGTAAV